MRPLILALALTLSLTSFSKIEKKEIGDRLIYDITVDKFEKIPVMVFGSEFTKTQLLGISPFEGAIQKLGRPETPVIRLYVHGEGEIKVTPSAREYSGRRTKNPYLTGKSLPKRAGVIVEAPVKLPATAEEYARFDKDFTITDVGISRGVRRRLVSLFALQFDPTTGAETRISQFTVDVPKPPTEKLEQSRLVVLVPEKYEANATLASWIDHKRKGGWAPIVEKIAQQSPAQIRESLKTHYQNSPEISNVVVIGDVDGVPTYSTSTLMGYTDHYYAALDGNYDSDLASPDVQVSRVPAQNEEQLDDILNRFMKYSQVKNDSTPWLRRNSFLATDDRNFWKITETSFTAAMARYFAPQGFLGSFPSANQKGGDHLFSYTHKAGSKELQTALSEGRGFVFYSGHGLHNEWDSPGLRIDEVPDLNLGGAHPFVFALACETGRLNLDSIAEAWVQRKDGAVSSVGSWADTYWDEDFVVQKGLLDSLIERRESIGRAVQHAKEEVYRYYGGENHSDYYMETYQLFSDPALRFGDL